MIWAFSRNFNETLFSWTVEKNTQINELMIVIASQFPINSVHKNDENPIFQLWESNTCLYTSTLNKCKIMFDLICCYMHQSKFSKLHLYRICETSEAISSTHSFAYLYRLFKKCFVEITKLHNFISSIFPPPPPILIKFSLFCLIFLFLLN